MEGARKGTLRRVGAHWHWRSKVVWFFVWGSEHTTWDLGALGTRRLHRQAAWLHAPETPESLGPLQKELVEWRKHNTDGAEPLQSVQYQRPLRAAVGDLALWHYDSRSQVGEW